MSDLHVELLRRLTTVTPGAGGPVWDARVVDDRGQVLSTCDHGHPTRAEAEACAEEQVQALGR